MRHYININYSFEIFACIGFFKIMCVPFRFCVLFTNLHKFSILSCHLPINTSLDPWSNVSLEIQPNQRHKGYSCPITSFNECNLLLLEIGYLVAACLFWLLAVCLGWKSILAWKNTCWLSKHLKMSKTHR